MSKQCRIDVESMANRPLRRGGRGGFEGGVWGALCLINPSQRFLTDYSLSYFRQEKRAQRLTFWVRRLQGGVGVLHAKGWWSKSSLPPSKVCFPFHFEGGNLECPGVLPEYPVPLGVSEKLLPRHTFWQGKAKKHKHSGRDGVWDKRDPSFWDKRDLSLGQTEIVPGTIWPCSGLLHSKFAILSHCSWSMWGSSLGQFSCEGHQKIVYGFVFIVFVPNTLSSQTITLKKHLFFFSHLLSN